MRQWASVIVLLLLTQVLLAQRKDYRPLIKSLQRQMAAMPTPQTAEAQLQQARLYNKLAKLQAYHYQYESAIASFEQELALRANLKEEQNELAQQKVHYNLATLHRQVGHYAKAKKHAQKYLAKAAQAANQLDGHQLLASILFKLGDQIAFQQQIQKAQQIAKADKQFNTEIELYMLKANAEMDWGAMETAKKSLAQAKNIIDQQEITMDQQIQWFKNQAIWYEYNNEYTHALAHHSQALQLLEASSPQSLEVAWLHDYIGGVYLLDGQYELAIRAFQKALALQIQLRGADNRKTAQFMGHLGGAYLKNEQLDSARYYLEKSIGLAQKLEGKYTLLQIYPLQKLADLYQQQGNFDRFYQSARQSEAIYQQHYKTQHPDRARLYYNIALYAFEEGDSRRGMSYLNRSFTENRAADNDGKTVFWMDHALLAKQLLLFPTYETDLTHFLPVIMSALEEELIFYNSFSDKKRWLSILHQLYEKNITHFYQRFTQEENSEDMDAVIWCLNRSKSLLYQEQEQRLNQLSGENRDSLRFLIAQHKLKEAEWLNGGDFSNVLSIQRQIKNMLPEGASSNGQNWTSLKEVQAALQPEEQLLEYFWGQESVYCLHLTSNAAKFYQLDTAVFEALQAALAALRAPGLLAGQDWPAIQQALGQKLQALSKQLIPFELDVSKPQLSIIADGPLHYLPFEALLLSQKELPSKMAKWPFLLDQYACRYLFSEAMLKSKQPEATGGLLAFSPKYNYETAVRIPLAGASAEYNWLAGRYRGHFHCELNKSALLKELPRRGIVHLAMHAFLPDEQAAYLLLPKDSVHMLELSGLNLESVDLLVLSACQTGFGEYQQGEGVMSLGRAFSYAGVHSMLYSLWPLQDRAAQRLMEEFYLGLEQGWSKDRALQQAKLNYLEEAGRLGAHPQFWAAMVLWGDRSPILLEKPSVFEKWWYLWGIGAVLLMGLFCWKAWKRRGYLKI